MLFLSTPSARRATRGQSCCLRRCRYFYPRPPRGGRPGYDLHPGSTGYFYPRPPRGGRLEAGRASIYINKISIHALREEGDPSCPSFPGRQPYFYPRPPRGGRRDGVWLDLPTTTISIHALREEGDAAVNDLLQRHNISIHALREEGDPFRHRSERVKEDFYPRPPRGGRHRAVVRDHECRGFLSTPSARRATPARFSRGKLLS